MPVEQYSEDGSQIQEKGGEYGKKGHFQCEIPLVKCVEKMYAFPSSLP
jgi:hypothetical protein